MPLKNLDKLDFASPVRTNLDDLYKIAVAMDEIGFRKIKVAENKINVKIKRLHPDAVIPSYAREGDAGFDLVAIEDVIIEPGETALVKTGLAFQIPEGYELQVRPRSGVSLKTKLRVANAPGTVDSGFRGEVGVIIDNISQAPKLVARKVKTITDEIINSENREQHRFDTYLIRKGDRICQAVLQRVPIADFIEVESLEETERGGDAFGSTGIK